MKVSLDPVGFWVKLDSLTICTHSIILLATNKCIPTRVPNKDKLHYIVILSNYTVMEALLLQLTISIN